MQLPHINRLNKKCLINTFSFGLLFLLFLMLSWVVYDKHSNYIDRNLNAADTAVKNTAEAIRYSLHTKKRILDGFVRDHRSEIIELINQPANQLLFSNIYSRLQKVLPDLFTINIANPDGSLIIIDFDGFTGDMCVQDLKSFVNTEQHLKRTHPNNILYHYDEISALTYNQHTYLFFASFSLNEIVKSLRFATPEDHNIILINQEQNNLVEITERGGRDKIPNRLDFRLTDAELNSIISTADVSDTHWTVIDLQDKQKINAHLYELAIPASIIFLLVSIATVLMRNIINQNFKTLTELSNELIIRNSEVLKLNYELENISVTDALTGLYNRRYFDQQFVTEWNRAGREQTTLCVMLIDIDYFKKFNDHYGHIEGDRCLVTVAKVLQSCISRNNEFIARYGGEEFCAVMSGSAEDCQIVADAIHTRLSEACIEHHHSEMNQVSVSIGIADLSPRPGIQPQILIERADIALYQAKKEGRNRTVIYKQSSAETNTDNIHDA